MSRTLKRLLFYYQPKTFCISQPPHEVVFALPLRDDGKIWSGKVSFTASKPIEVEILHINRPQQPIDESHGEPYHAVYQVIGVLPSLT